MRQWSGVAAPVLELGVKSRPYAFDEFACAYEASAITS